MKKLIFFLLLSVNIMLSQSWVKLNDIGTIISGTTTSTVPYKEALCFSVNGKIYVVGAVTPTSITPTAMVWEYDPLLDSWKEKANYPGLGNLRLCGFNIGNNLYVGTGRNNSNSLLYSDFYKYNIGSNTWSAIANFPTVREGASGFSIVSDGYVCCGSISYTSNPTDLWKYDTTSNAWQPKANFPGVHRIGASTFTALNKGFVGLGYSYTLSIWNSDFYTYNPSTDTWSNIATFPGAGRLGAGAVSINDFGIVFCGNSGMPVLNDCYIYDALSDNWSNYITFVGAQRSNVIYGSVGNKVFAGGGNTAGGVGVFSDWWSLQTAVGVSEFSSTNEIISIYQINDNTVRLKWLKQMNAPINFTVYDTEGKIILKDNLESNNKTFHINSTGLYFIRFENEAIKPAKFIIR